MPDDQKRSSSSGSMIAMIFRIILRTRRLRRNLMFGLTIAMMIFVFLGAYPLAGFLSGHPWIFLFYWLFCTFLVITAIILAIYDMLRVTQEGREDLGRFDLEDLQGELDKAKAQVNKSKKDKDEGDKND